METETGDTLKALVMEPGWCAEVMKWMIQQITAIKRTMKGELVLDTVLGTVFTY